MRTELIDVSSGTWTELTGGAVTILVQPRISGVLHLHFSNSLTPPEDGEYHIFQNWKGPLNLIELGFIEGQRIWAKTPDGAGKIVVTRDVIGYESLEDNTGDPLIDSNGLALQVREAT